MNNWSPIEGTRLLVLGGTGWIGRNAALLARNHNCPVMLISRSTRSIEIANQQFQSFSWDAKLVESFSPTHVIDSAFITPDFIESLGVEQFITKNRLLIKRAVDCVKIPSVLSLMTISSGAATNSELGKSQSFSKEIYGSLKLESEYLLSEATQEFSKKLIISRAWSLSGPHIDNQEKYALSSFITQAKAGKILINSSEKVWRKYSSIFDLLNLGLKAMDSNNTFTNNVVKFETGGQLIEITELAKKVANLINPKATVFPNKVLAGVESKYFSTDNSWENLCAELSLLPMNLDQQIIAAANV